MGVRLEGAVVVVDEAHNIVEAINSVHSKKVVLSEVRVNEVCRQSVHCEVIIVVGVHTAVQAGSEREKGVPPVTLRRGSERALL